MFGQMQTQTQLRHTGEACRGLSGAVVAFHRIYRFQESAVATVLKAWDAVVNAADADVADDYGQASMFFVQ